MVLSMLSHAGTRLTSLQCPRIELSHDGFMHNPQFRLLHYRPSGKTCEYCENLRSVTSYSTVVNETCGDDDCCTLELAFRLNGKAETCIDTLLVSVRGCAVFSLRQYLRRPF